MVCGWWLVRMSLIGVMCCGCRDCWLMFVVVVADGWEERINGCDIEWG